MNTAAYAAVCSNIIGAGVHPLPSGFIRVTGRDRIKYLQGQISNDVASAVPGDAIPACLLNNTGHLLAYLLVYINDDSVVIRADCACVPIAIRTLEKYIVRERVEVTPFDFSAIDLKGTGATAALSSVFGHAVVDALRAGRFQTVEFDGITVNISPYTSQQALPGFTLFAESGAVERTISSLLNVSHVHLLDDETAHVIRVEAGEPAWGYELDESVIPLEAGLDDAISYTKGCYMGQEIIARIHSRGHTNRTLTGFRFDSLADVGTAVQAVGGDKAGLDVGRITSFADSQRFGPIGLGYIRNEYASPGTTVYTTNGKATVTQFPQQND